MTSIDTDPTPPVSIEPSSGGSSSPSLPTLVVPAPSGPFPSDASLQVFIDDTDVTQCSISGSWTPRLNRAAQATVTLPMDCATGDAGSRMRVYINSTLVFHGFVLNTETDTDKDGGTTIYNAMDPMELWAWRPVRADDGDFSKPAGSGETDGKDIIATYDNGSDIMYAVLNNSIDTTAGGGGPPPATAEGPIFLYINAVTSNGPSLAGAPVDWPMTIQQFASLLISTGTLDLVITPSELGASGEMGYVDFYDGSYGTDLSGSVQFSYGMGDYNIDSLRWNRDMTSVVNKYWIYGGPRIGTASDAAGDQHWCFNVTGQDPYFTPPGGAMVPPGGESVDAFNLPVGPPWTDNPIGERIYNSRVAYGVRMKIDIFDAYDLDCVPGFGTVGHDLYRRQWQEFSYLSAVPRELIHITPTRDTEIGSFGIGDLIGVEAVPDVRGGFSGIQRVYEYTISWEGTDSVLTLGEIQTSADADFSA